MNYLLNLQRSVNILQGTVSKDESEILKLENQLCDKNEAYLQVKNQCGDLHSQLERTVAEKEEFAGKCDINNSEISDLKAKLLEQIRQIENAVMERNSNIEKCEDIGRNLCAVEKSNEEFQNRLDKSLIENTNLRNDVATKEAENVSAHEAHQELAEMTTKEREEMLTEIKCQKNQIGQHAKEIDILKAELQNSELSYEEQLSELTLRLGEFSKQPERYEGCDNEGRTITQISDELIHTKLHLKTANERVTILEAKLKESTDAALVQEGQGEDAEKLHADNVLLQQECSERKEKIDTLLKDAERLFSQNKRYAQELDELKLTTLTEKQHTIQQHNDEMDELKVKH